MNFLFNTKRQPPSTAVIPPTSPLQQQRLEQIKSLNTLNQNVVEVKRDMDYRVTFLAASQNVSLNIHLPSGFPNEKPYVTISPRIMNHPWINEQGMVVGYSGINSFYMHSDLGKVVQQLIKEFTKLSPKNFTPTSFTTSLPSNEPSRPPPYREVPSNRQPVEDEMMGEIETVMKDLESLSKVDLEKICSDQDRIIGYIENMSFVSEIRNQRFEQIKTNADIAKKNLSHEPTVEELKGSLKELCEESNDLYHSFQDKSQQQDELAQMFDLGNILTNLRISVLQAEEESEQIADDFLGGNLQVDEFLNMFMEKRKLCHMRRAKEERLKTFATE